MTQSLILASKSEIRQKILHSAGVNFRWQESAFDEDAVKKEWKGDDHGLALALASGKAQNITDGVAAGNLILGADQLLRCDGQLYDKARSLEDAIDRLLFFQGKTHELIGGYVIVQNATIIWQHVSVSKLTMRPLSRNKIQAYVEYCGEEILKSVGCYQVEGAGIQLFEAIDGDLFAVQGLDVIAVLKGLSMAGFCSDLFGE